MQDKSKVILFIDEETVPVAEFMAPANFELDTRKITDGRHRLKIVSKGPDGKEGIRIVPFEVRNGPHIDIEGIQEEAVVDGVIPLMINAYSKGNANKFYIEGSETPKSIPAWVWIMLITIAAWSLFYLFTYIKMPAVS